MLAEILAKSRFWGSMNPNQGGSWGGYMASTAIPALQTLDWDSGSIQDLMTLAMTYTCPHVEACAVVQQRKPKSWQEYVTAKSSNFVGTMNPNQGGSWRGGIAVEAIYPPQLPPWLGFVLSLNESRFCPQESQPMFEVCAVVNGKVPWGQVYVNW